MRGRKVDGNPLKRGITGTFCTLQMLTQCPPDTEQGTQGKQIFVAGLGAHRQVQKRRGLGQVAPSLGEYIGGCGAGLLTHCGWSRNASQRTAGLSRVWKSHGSQPGPGWCQHQGQRPETVSEHCSMQTAGRTDQEFGKQ